MQILRAVPCGADCGTTCMVWKGYRHRQACSDGEPFHKNRMIPPILHLAVSLFPIPSHGIDSTPTQSGRETHGMEAGSVTCCMPVSLATPYRSRLKA